MEMSPSRVNYRFHSNSQSVIARGLLAEVAEKSKFLPLFMNFSAQTTSKRVQENIEGKLEKRGKSRLGKHSDRDDEIYNKN